MRSFVVSKRVELVSRQHAGSAAFVRYVPFADMIEMRGFQTWESFWLFRISVSSRQRFVREDHAEDFLRTLLEQAEEREELLPAGSFLWRAQLGHTWRDEYHPEPYAPERMKPLADRAREGRANPKGIPVLYLATAKETAMAEVRPWKGSLISVGQFETLKEVRLVDCVTEDTGSILHLRGPSPNQRDATVWRHVDEAFSEPTDRSDDGTEYVATQVIADAFRARGYDGIMYRSGLGDGHNVALFDLDAAEIRNCCMYSLDHIDLDFSQAGNPYFIRNQEDTGESDGAANGT